MQSAELIGWALGGLEREIVETKKRLAALSAQAVQLRNRMGKGRLPGPVAAPNAAAVEGGKRRRRRRMSPEARKRISEMMKKRWAERRKKA
jgi:hypothetical protein